MGAAVGLKIGKSEASVAFTGRARLLCTRLQKEGVNCPSVARKCLIQRGCRLGSFSQATVVSATRGTSTKSAEPFVRRFLGARWIARRAGHLPSAEEGFELDAEDDLDMMVDTEVEHEIEAIIAWNRSRSVTRSKCLPHGAKRGLPRLKRN